MKIIKIKTCIECPFRACLPILDGIKRVPYCFKGSSKNRMLPYVLATKSIEPTAAPANTIPDWCPLDDVSLPAQVLL